MASIRKKLSMIFGPSHEGSSSTGKVTSVDVSKRSLDSGYHSVIAKSSRRNQDALSQETTFVTSGMESSLERSPRKLHKAISSTFSGALQAFSNTVRSTTSYIYPSAGDPELPSSEWAECETPKKESRRSSLMSSIRSRKRRGTPGSRGVDFEFKELRQSPVPMIQDKAPAIDVEIPNGSISSVSLGKGSLSTGSQLLAGVKLPAGPKNLWPGPTRLTVDQASNKDGRESLRSVPSQADDPYVEEGGRFQDGFFFSNAESEFDLECPSPKTNKRHLGDREGYFPEAESNSDVSESDGLPPASLKDVAPMSTDVKASSKCRNKSPAAFHVYVASSASPCQRTISSRMSSSVSLGSEFSNLETSHGTAEQTPSLRPSNRTSSHHCASLEDKVSALFPSFDVAMTSKAGLLYNRRSPDVYDADAESLESSMGSRAAWERHRAERERRYMKIIDMFPSTESNEIPGPAPSTESDEEMEPELELKRSPSKKPVHYAEELFQGNSNNSESNSTRRYPAGDLRFAVEAIERPPVTTFDPLETVFQQRPMLPLSDTTDEQPISLVSDPWNVSSSCMANPSTTPADLSPSRVELPSSPESSPLEIPAVPKHRLMMKLADGELSTSKAGNLDGNNIRYLSSGFTDVSENSSPEYQSHTAQGDAYEAGLKAGNLLVPTYLRSVGEDAYEAGLRAAGIDMPMFASDVVNTKPTIDSLCKGSPKATSYCTPISKQTTLGTYREQLEAGSPLPKPRPRNGTPFEHSRTVSFFSDDTDDSCAITTNSPSCNVPPPFPSLHVRSEPARRSPSAIDALVTHGDEQIRIAGPANAGIKASLPSPFDGSGDQIDEAGSRLFSPKTLEGPNSPDTYAQVTCLEQHDLQSPVTWLEQHDLQSPSPGTTSSIQSPINNTPQETFNAAELPTLVSPSHALSRKARRKRKKSSSGAEKVPPADLTTNPKNTVSQPDFSPSKREPSKTSVIGKTQNPPIESPRIAQASNQKTSLDGQLSGKKGRVRDQTSLEGFTESFAGNIRWLDPSSGSKSSKKSPSSKGKAAATLPLTPSPPRMTMARARGRASAGRLRGNAVSADKDSNSCLDPELSAENCDTVSDTSPLYANRRSGSSSHAGHELDSIFWEDASVSFSYDLDADSQQDSDNTAVDLAGGDETIDNDSGSDEDVLHASGQKKTVRLKKKGKPPREVGHCARSPLVLDKKSGVLGDDHTRQDDSVHKEEKRRWRPPGGLE